MPPILLWFHFICFQKNHETPNKGDWEWWPIFLCARVFFNFTPQFWEIKNWLIFPKYFTQLVGVHIWGKKNPKISQAFGKKKTKFLPKKITDYVFMLLGIQ